MQIKDIESFLDYYGKTRKVTSKVVQAIPPESLDWTYVKGKFTIGDLVRHIAATERYVFAEVVVGKKSSYKGCGKELADGYEKVIAYFNEMHLQTIEILRTLTTEQLHAKVISLDGKEIEAANFLRALLVHEIHHRGALCIYLNMLGVKTPPVIGLTEEEVIQAGKS